MAGRRKKNRENVSDDEIYMVESKIPEFFRRLLGKEDSEKFAISQISRDRAKELQKAEIGGQQVPPSKAEKRP